MTDRLHRYSLRSVLVFDAATCAVMGVLPVSASGLISGITQIPAPLLLWSGLVLLPTAAF